MVEIEAYMKLLVKKLQAEFGARLCYVGLQGSYLRGEAQADSDIDVMVLLEDFSIEDMERYREILQKLGHYDLSCGFICSAEEIRSWNQLELCHLLHTTKDYFGRLSGFVSAYSREDVREFTKLSLNNLYHALCHSYIHRGAARTFEKLHGMFKSTFFILQSITYLKTGEYAATKQALLEKLEGRDREVLLCAMGLRDYASEEALHLLFLWLKEHITTI